MIILPAIDIKDGNCVRLVKGDFATVHRVAEDPLETALGFRASGAVWLHMVDLDGALQGARVNAAVFTQIAAESGLKVELGGGIRDMAAVDYYLSHGVQRVILGSAALTNPQLVDDAVRNFGEQIAVGIDAKNRMVATRGWLDASEVDFIEMAKRVEDKGVKYIIFTDISRDGTLSGPSIDQLTELKNAVDCKIIASGGIGQLSDIDLLTKADLYGAICGKALYAGTLSLSQAIMAGGDQSC
ncbi:1-(5-phosphoribosyl)-5-[(5-phosphoribosylamino)methylideneamino]imidazole-4-carboxamide isomerase [Oscillospiraceae bacterium LTW-04]|nr:1-(5-phosphoribosyl)-5-[(5-phosphoribosylamino)methylideneamino]imidazole-4-carboxamide isomerase [Oscillospiraceae bacterium MB24-C1]